MTPQEAVDRLVFQIKTHRDTLNHTPDIPPLRERRVRLEGRLEGLRQALALARQVA